MQPLQNKWFLGIPESEKESLSELIRNSTILLGQLTKVIEAEIEQNDSLSAADYDSPSWAYRQADRNGALRVLRNLLKLTKPKDHNK